MGSGHFPEEGNHKAAYMMDLKLFDKKGNSYDSPIFLFLSKKSIKFQKITEPVLNFENYPNRLTTNRI